MSDERRTVARMLAQLLDDEVPVVVDESLPWDEISVGADLRPGTPGDELTITVGERANLDFIIWLYTLHERWLA